MVKNRLEDRIKANGRFPSDILYYRDGVGNIRYEAICTSELPQIKTTFAEVCAHYMADAKLKKTVTNIPKKPKLTAVIATKCHHTRFYSNDDSNKNCKPGTCVDSGVTHSVCFDFYLQSHRATEGTAKPTYYFVLLNEIDFSPKVI
jgi:eukaryotic translation initiation factor 2C